MFLVDAEKVREDYVEDEYGTWVSDWEEALESMKGRGWIVGPYDVSLMWFNENACGMVFVDNMGYGLPFVRLASLRLDADDILPAAYDWTADDTIDFLEAIAQEANALLPLMRKALS